MRCAEPVPTASWNAAFGTMCFYEIPGQDEGGGQASPKSTIFNMKIYHLWPILAEFGLFSQGAALSAELECFASTKFEALAEHLTKTWPGGASQVKFVLSGDHAEGPQPTLEAQDTAIDPESRLDEYCGLLYICQIFVEFILKCRDNVELLLKNDDFALKNGRLFCDWRYCVTATGAPVSEGPHNRLVVAAIVDGEKYVLNNGQPLVMYHQSNHPRISEAWGKSGLSSMLNPLRGVGMR